MWSYLQQPYVEPSWTYITDPKAIKVILLKWQQHHYTQANSTLFANPAWLNPKDPTTISQQEVMTILQDTLDQDHQLNSAIVALFHKIKNNIIPTMPQTYN